MESNFVYYQYRDGKYYVKEKNYGCWIMSVLGFFGMLYAISLFVEDGVFSIDHLFVGVIAPFAFTLAWLVHASKKTWINVNQRQIVRTYLFGLVKQQYTFYDFIQFYIVRTSMNLIYSGTDVKMKMKKKFLFDDTFTLKSFYFKTKRTEAFIHETRAIMDSSISN